MRRLTQTGVRALASLTVENYVKAIFKICQQNGSRLATTGRLAAALGVSPGTVTSMLKALSDSGLANYTPYEGALLTEAGNHLAREILRRHRLIETFLASVLNMGWDEVHEDAEQLEHAVSDRLINRIDAYLGHPQFDPHGDPIPGPGGEIPHREAEVLIDCRAGSYFELAQVLDQTGDFLKYLRSSGFSLGCRGQVVANKPEAGIVTVLVGGREVPLSTEVAQKLLVEVENHAKAEPARDWEISPSAVPPPHLRSAAIRAPNG